MALQLELPGLERLGVSNEELIEKLRQLGATPCPRGDRREIDAPVADDKNQLRWVLASEMGSKREDRRLINHLKALASVGEIEMRTKWGRVRFRAKPNQV